jgi:hypothetical protein
MYARVPHGTARTGLLVLHDSLYVFRNGRPQVSFAHRVGKFSYEDVMGQSVSPTDPILTNRHVKVAA